MDWIRLRAALIRALYTTVFPTIASILVYFANPGQLEEWGVTNPTVVLYLGPILGGLSAIMYGIKKYAKPDGTW